MTKKTYEVIGNFKKARPVVLGRFGTQAEALFLARESADNFMESHPDDTLVSVIVSDTATGQTLGRFYPDRYEADCLDDDDDG